MATVMDEVATAEELAARSDYRYPNESAAYRRARTDLLVEEIALRRQIEHVAERRRALPPGGEVPKDYVFEGEGGTIRFSELFGAHDTLIVYNYMFGPERERPCPMCTALLGPLDANVPDIERNVAVAVVARSPIARLTAFKRERGWRNLPLYADTTEEFGRDYLAWTDKGDNAAFNVFTRRDGKIRHFWGAEMSMETADPGQDPRGAPDMTPLWNILDTTPRGRNPHWYPKVDYD
jgi:predicted dithiol-disulfide oxidoreductase (DUF899 family)